MIREIDVVPAWHATIKPHTIAGLCNVGRVIARFEQSGVTLMYRVWLLDGRTVRVPAEAVTAIPPTQPGDLDIPPVPEDAATGAVVTASPTPAVASRDLARRGRIFGASAREMIEAGFGIGIQP